MRYTCHKHVELCFTVTNIGYLRDVTTHISIHCVTIIPVELKQLINKVHRIIKNYLLQATKYAFPLSPRACFYVLNSDLNMQSFINTHYRQRIGNWDHCSRFICILIFLTLLIPLHKQQPLSGYTCTLHNITILIYTSPKIYKRCFDIC